MPLLATPSHKTPTPHPSLTAAYNPYFLGWDARGWAQPQSGVVVVHHPAGDVKKIAYSNRPLQRNAWCAAPLGLSGMLRLLRPPACLAAWGCGTGAGLGTVAWRALQGNMHVCGRSADRQAGHGHMRR